MGINIKSVDQSLENSGLKILVHGMAGSGKTTMAATTGVPTLIISAESGLLSLKGAPDYIQVVEVKNIDELGEVYEMLDTTQHGFEWVILDSISEIGEVVLSAEKKANKDARAAYGNMIDLMTTMMKLFRDLPVNIMMTCKQQRIEDSDTGHTVCCPQLPGARLANDLPYLFDLVCALRVEEDKDAEGNPFVYRTLQTGSDIRHTAKDRSGALEMFEEPNLEAIYKKIYGDAKIVAPVVQPEETVDSDEENISESDRYYFHDESESAFLLPAGEPLTEDIAAHCTEMTEEEYAAFRKLNPIEKEAEA